jgi:hypothetical protein
MHVAPSLGRGTGVFVLCGCGEATTGSFGIAGATGNDGVLIARIAAVVGVFVGDVRPRPMFRLSCVNVDVVDTDAGDGWGLGKAPGAGFALEVGTSGGTR